MSGTKKYRVIQRGSSDRDYELRELVWLWRSGMIAHDATFLDEEGGWQAVQNLVEPTMEERKRAQVEQDLANCHGPKPVPQSPRRSIWVAAGIVFVVVAFAPLLRALYLNQRSASGGTAEMMDRERSERIEDFIAEGRVVLGMSSAEVIRVRGTPKRKTSSPQTQREQWFYPRQVVTFELGIVTQTSDAPTVQRNARSAHTRRQ